MNIVNKSHTIEGRNVINTLEAVDIQTGERTTLATFDHSFKDN